MNRERMIALADALECRRFPKNTLFSMDYISTPIGVLRHQEIETLVYGPQGALSVEQWPACGTVCCVAGMATHLAGLLRHTEEQAERWLGLRNGQGNSLFYPPNSLTTRVVYDLVTPEQAAEVIRDMVRRHDDGETDVVADWTAVAKQQQQGVTA